MNRMPVAIYQFFRIMRIRLSQLFFISMKLNIQQQHLISIDKSLL